MAQITLLDTFLGSPVFTKTPVGGPGTFTGWPTTPPAGNPYGWTDLNGSVANINGSNPYYGYILPPFQNSYYKAGVVRNETSTDQEFALYFGMMSDFSGAGAIPGIMLRYAAANGNSYLVQVHYLSGTTWEIRGFRFVVGTAGRTVIGTPSAITGAPTSDWYGFRAGIAGTGLYGYLYHIGSTPPSQTNAPTVLTPGMLVGSWTATDGSIAGPGSVGVNADTGNNGDLITIASVLATTPLAATDCYAVEPSIAINATSTVHVNGWNTAWTGGTTFSVTGGTGASVTGQSVTGQQATLTVAAGSTVGTLTIHNTTDGGTTTVQAALPTPTVGALSTSSNTAAGVDLTSTLSGITTPYQIDLWRASSPASLTVPFLPPASGGTKVATLTGLSSLTPTITDPSPLASEGFYIIVATGADGASNRSRQGTGYDAWEELWQANVINLACLGDSITFGTGATSFANAYPSIMAAYLRQMLPTYTVNLINANPTYQPILGQVGTTTGTYNLASALAVLQSQAANLITTMWGTNDAATANQLPVATYQSNLGNINNSLIAHGFTRVQNDAPPYQVPGKGAMLQTPGLNLLMGYRDTALPALANGVTVFRGDVASFDIMMRNQAVYMSGDGTHPPNAGHALLGENKAIKALVNFFPNAGGGGTTVLSRAGIRTGGGF